MVRIAIDAMGGDNAPAEIVKGCVAALADTSVFLTLVGQTRAIEAELVKYAFDRSRLDVADAQEVIGFDETPTTAVKTKKNSSLVVGLNLLKDGKASAFISAGSTGAILTGATLIVGRLRGASGVRVERPFLAAVLPCETGRFFLADAGANAECKPSYLLQFAQIGALYMEHVEGVKNPRIGLVNIGTEKEKGNALTKEAYALFEGAKSAAFNFTGNVEPREIPRGAVDVAVCDGFVGNVILKYSEGLTKSLLTMIKTALMANVKTKIGALLSKGAFADLKKTFDPSNVGGAPFLGLDALVVKTHGGSDAKTIENAVKQCKTFIENDITGKIKAVL